jgi:hypothetical protein
MATQVYKLALLGKIYNSGVLLAGGQYILTAAHLFSAASAPSDLTITDMFGQSVAHATAINIHPSWQRDASNFNHDLALIKLDQPLTGGYDIYRGNAEIGQTFTRIGYVGNHLVEGQNTYDAYTNIINPLFGKTIESNTQLLYDYDDGTFQHDALGVLFNVNNLGLGTAEGMSQAGLSGAPTFINNQIAGIGSYIFRSDATDVNSITDSSVGEMGSDMRVSTETDWIDYVTKGNPVYAAPTLKADVMTSVPEPNYGEALNYFLAAFGEPLKQNISFDYRTLDGTAIAGLDYIAAQGHIDLHVGEDHIAIPVMILGDKIVEGDEMFELEVSNFVGFSMPNGEITLVAAHTIVDNDTLL